MTLDDLFEQGYLTEERLEKMLRFGPVYGEERAEFNGRVKDLAWQHIVEKSYGDEASYVRSIKAMEKEVRDYYNDCSGSEEWQRTHRGAELHRGAGFRKMMVRDGCLFLQLALHILGAGELLGYPKDHHIFEENSDYPVSCIPYMFFVGNQIPYIVINALMNQPFFKDVIARRGNEYWRRPSKDDGGVKLALYQTVVEPQLMTTKSSNSTNILAHHHPPLFNILTALRNVLLGSNDNPAAMTEFQDLELGYTTDDKPVRFRRASELKRSGVELISKAGIGISSIRFKNRGYSATLYLPPFHIRTHTIELLTSLVQHERRMTVADREVTAYISFMRDLAPTYKDFKILQDQGIIQVHEPHLTSSVMSSLDKIVSRSDYSYLTPNFSEIMSGIKEYETVPWQRISFTCSIACGIITFFLTVFTIVQTVFTVLSYYHTTNPPN